MGLKGLSTELQASMKSTPTLQAFVDYYGMYDYGDEWVNAGFEARNTKFRNFNNDLSLYSYDGWGQVIKKGTAYVIVWMWVLREMEEALSQCNSGSSVNDDAVCSWTAPLPSTLEPSKEPMVPDRASSP